MSWYTNPKVWSFVGGVGAALLGREIVLAKKTRELAVTAVAKGMQLQQTCQENLQSIKDDATDLAEEAIQQAQSDAALADRRAQIEARIREQVEAEMAAQEAAAEEADDSQE